MDGTVRPICRPSQQQRILYNGRKRIHAIKFQSVVITNGLIANFSGLYEEEKHDRGMLTESGFLTNLEHYSYSPTGDLLCIYGDPAYPLRPHLEAPFRVLRLTEQEIAYKKAIVAARVNAQWGFGNINFF